MASHGSDNGPLEVGASMDYNEHDRTYSGFLTLAKYGTLACIALMISMAFGFFVGGFFSGLVVFALIMAIGWLLL